MLITNTIYHIGILDVQMQVRGLEKGWAERNREFGALGTRLWMRSHAFQPFSSASSSIQREQFNMLFRVQERNCGSD